MRPTADTMLSVPKQGIRNSRMSVQLLGNAARGAVIDGAAHDEDHHGSTGACPHDRFCDGSAERWKRRQSEQRRRRQHKLCWRWRIGPLTGRIEKAPQRAARSGRGVVEPRGEVMAAVGIKPTTSEHEAARPPWPTNGGASGWMTCMAYGGHDQ